MTLRACAAVEGGDDHFSASAPACVWGCGRPMRSVQGTLGGVRPFWLGFRGTLRRQHYISGSTRTRPQGRSAPRSVLAARSTWRRRTLPRSDGLQTAPPASPVARQDDGGHCDHAGGDRERAGELERPRARRMRMCSHLNYPGVTCATTLCEGGKWSFCAAQ